MAGISIGHILNFKADMEHEHAEKLRAIADNKDVRLEQTCLSTKGWKATNSDNALAFIAAGCGKVIRIAPKTIRIGDMDVPPPMRVAPEIGTDYWLVALLFESVIHRHTWTDCALDLLRLKRGLCHLKEADCRTNAEALIKASGGVL